MWGCPQKLLWEDLQLFLMGAKVYMDHPLGETLYNCTDNSISQVSAQLNVVAHGVVFMGRCPSLPLSVSPAPPSTHIQTHPDSSSLLLTTLHGPLPSE